MKRKGEEEAEKGKRMAITIVLISWKILLHRGLYCHDNGCVPYEMLIPKTVSMIDIEEHERMRGKEDV